jgi:hypothetical protein
MFASVRASDSEKAASAGDALVAPADVVMDRAFTVDAPIEGVWPWLQLGIGMAAGLRECLAGQDPAAERPA